ncbi:MAG TPA: hypothetical protein VN455_14465 [Methanotrichaceae archaeon]|nr:hypothetical protein [Methanotrichaceae archaeon]
MHYELAPLVRSYVPGDQLHTSEDRLQDNGLAAGPLRLPLASMAEEKEKVLKEIIGRVDEYS